MYARTGKLISRPGQREALIEILLQAANLVGRLPDCKFYTVYADREDINSIWVVEIWKNQSAHAASLQDEGVRALIGQGMPLIAGMQNGAEMDLRGGYGLAE